MTTIERAARPKRDASPDEREPRQGEPERMNGVTLVERAGQRLGPVPPYARARVEAPPCPPDRPALPPEVPAAAQPVPPAVEPVPAAEARPDIPLQADAPPIGAPVARPAPHPAPAEHSGAAASPADAAATDSGAQPTALQDRPMAVIDIGWLERKGFVSPSKPTTRVAEEFRLVKRPLLRSAFVAGPNRRPNSNVLMVTSSAPREGKTFVATNLAISIASERDVFVLLIDADVAQPGIFRTLGLSEGPGLTDLLADPLLDPSSVIQRTSIEKLSVMSAGTPHSLASELLASQRMRQIVEEVATRYQDRIIIFDSPPLLARSEPSVLAHGVGQIVFVVEADRTSESEVRAAMDLIDDCENVSVVLNKSSSLFMQSSFGQYFSKYDQGRGKSHENR